MRNAQKFESIIYLRFYVLSDRELLIIKLRYGLGDSRCYTQKEIAKGLGISRSYVSRIEKKALEKLKKLLNQ